MNIKKNKVINMLLMLMIISCLFGEILYSYIPSMNFILFLPDLFCALIIVFIIFNSRNNGLKISLKKSNQSCIILGVFLLYVIISVIWSTFNFYNIVVRFRYIFFGIFTYCVVKTYLNNDTYKKIINLMSIVQILNMILTIYQNIIMGKHPDFCNGIFGFVGYANAAQGSFCVAISLLSLIYYISGTWKAIRSFSLIGMSCVICAFAEIKIYFVLFVIGTIGIIVIRKNSLKDKIKIFIGSVLVAILLYVAYRILLVVLPNNLYAFFSLSGYMSYDGRSTYAGRLNTIPYIYENLFHQNNLKALFGTGLGSNSFEYIYELGKLFSELGFLGLSIIVIFLISIFWFYFSPARKSTRTQEQMFCAVYAIIFFIAIVVWNCTFTRFTYLNFFFLALSSVTWENRTIRKGERE